MPAVYSHTLGNHPTVAIRQLWSSKTTQIISRHNSYLSSNFITGYDIFLGQPEGKWMKKIEAKRAHLLSLIRYYGLEANWSSEFITRYDGFWDQLKIQVYYSVRQVLRPTGAPTLLLSTTTLEFNWVVYGQGKHYRGIGRPKMQKFIETLLHRARLRVFSKLFLDLAFFFRSKIV